MSASNQSFLAKYEAVQKRQWATLRSLADDAVDDALADSDVALPDTVADAFRSDDDDCETVPQEQAPPDTEFDETQEDEEGGFSEQAKVCCKLCNRYRLISHYDPPTQLHLEANPVQCSTIGRSCSEPDDRLDMGVVDESTLFQGIDGHDKGCSFMELAGYAMVQVVGSDEIHMVPRQLLVGVPSTPPNYEPENRTLTRHERFIKTATEDRKYSFFYSTPCATIYATVSGPTSTILLPSESKLWATAKPRFDAVINTIPAKAGYELRSYGGGSCAKGGMRVKSLVNPFSSYLHGLHGRQLGLVDNVRAFYLEVKVPANAALHCNLGEVERRWVAALRSNSGVVIVNSAAVGNGGHADAEATDGFVSIFLECVVWNEYVGNTEAPVRPRTAFFRNSTSLHLKLGEAVTMRALGINRQREGTVELRCYRFHPVSGCEGSIEKKEDGSYEFDEAKVLKHYTRGLICCAHCAQLGFGMKGTGFRDYRCYQVERVMEEDGTIWVNTKDRKPMRDHGKHGNDTLSMAPKSSKRAAKTAKRKRKKVQA